MPPPATETYEFGPYRIDAAERLLYRGETVISLPPKVTSTLLVLVQNAGRMVDKDVLMKAVWPDTFVEEGALTRNISLLRKTLGDTGEQAVFIETIPKRGYRFLAPVQENCRADSKREPAVPVRAAAAAGYRWTRIVIAILLLAAVAAIARYAVRRADPAAELWGPAPSTVLAVLPFRSLTADRPQDPFADGMTQALITSLANLRQLRVVSLVSDPRGRVDSAEWNAILRDQAVHMALTGAIQRSGNRVRIDAQLIDPATRAVHWANKYERDLEDLIALESTVAEAIAEEIRGQLTERDRERLRQRAPVKPEALDAYLQGRSFWNRRTESGLQRAVKYFQQAIDLDPKYALAYSGLADSYSILGSIGTDAMVPNQAMPLAREAALKAIALDPELAEGHISLAYVKLSYDWDLPGAAREFSRGLSLNPNSATGRHWYSHYFMATGDMTKASEQMREALRLEPLSPSINIGIGWCFYYSRRFEQAIERFRAVAEMDPGLPLAHQTLGMAYQQSGRLDQAIEEFKRAAAFSNNGPASVAALASAYAAAGRLAEAREELARLTEMSRSRYVPALYFASVHNAMGDVTKTFEWGWKAIGERCDYLMYLRVEPRAGGLTSHPEFLRGMAALHR
jgi:TolB-like protein/DNA-binding winged helix-turn-helix (wHTH) protein/Tfp pilus assembly protein PilF